MGLRSVLRKLGMGGAAAQVHERREPAFHETVRLYKRLAAIRRLPAEPVPMRSEDRWRGAVRSPLDRGA